MKIPTSSERIKFKPFDYQLEMVEWLRERDEAALFCDPGLGKTVCTLQAWEEKFLNGESKGALIVAPIRVCNITWPVLSAA